MKETSPTIAKEPRLKPAEDYYHLRREGVRFIEQMASRLWTDYNEHDPGITILEALCYAITDLAYRSGWEMEDLLAPREPAQQTADPYPHQPFFTAREILPVNAWTRDDFRRLLIDLIAVRNAWLFCKDCACETSFYAWVDQGRQFLAYEGPNSQEPVWARGLYDVLLELEADPHLGDLNDRKIESMWIMPTVGATHSTVMELRFPQCAEAQRPAWELFLREDALFDLKEGEGFELAWKMMGTRKGQDDFTGKSLEQQNEYLRANWRNVFYASFGVTFVAVPAGEKDLKMITLTIDNAALRLFGDNAARRDADYESLKTQLMEMGTDGFIQRYRQKEKLKAAAVERARSALLESRNLDEDFCRIKVVGIEEVAVCADVKVRPDADIELVQAKIWFAIENCFNPAVAFHSLQELIDAGISVEEIFNGPPLDNGFILQKDLDASVLKSALRVSDLMNVLMDIDGVVAVNRLQLTKYDGDGQMARGLYDGSDKETSSAFWTLPLKPYHQPRLYRNASRFLFYKRGLPFLPRMDEALDTLTQLRGEAERPKIEGARYDLPVPTWSFRDCEGYFPVQYSLPLNYGTGPEGLPAGASEKRKAQMKQLKGYLMVFEQILGNAFAQISHVGELFSLNRGVAHSYFIKELSEKTVCGYKEIAGRVNGAKLQDLAESREEFLIRRNLFLDHILARFGEDFKEYALLMTGLDGELVALDRLKEYKISFLESYPVISRDRGKGFNYTEPPVRFLGKVLTSAALPDTALNFPPIKRRVNLLLGHLDLAFTVTSLTLKGGAYEVGYLLNDQSGESLLTGTIAAVTAQDESQVPFRAYHRLLGLMVQGIKAYKVDPSGNEYLLRLWEGGVEVGTSLLLGSVALAEALADKLVEWAAYQRMIVVEHLLLRPKFPGDALYQSCSDGNCEASSGHDPFYSFRLTYVMPGWGGAYNERIEMRRFAERTIKEETPAHLLPKICWVGNDGFDDGSCTPLLNRLVHLLEGKKDTLQKDTDTCSCAKAIYQSFSAAFQEWYRDRTLEFLHPDSLEKTLGELFVPLAKLDGISCVNDPAALADQLLAMMVDYFGDKVLYGCQFERFEDAWYTWLRVNACFNWTEERLQEEVETILLDSLPTVPTQGDLDKVRACAVTTLQNYGAQWSVKMEQEFRQGTYAAQAIIVQLSCTGGLQFGADAEDKVDKLLAECYRAYPEVSYRLWVVLNLLARLRNTYPVATLHDCDDGNDNNPVRLGVTALGS